jgi:hypothetical protein
LVDCLAAEWAQYEDLAIAAPRHRALAFGRAAISVASRSIRTAVAIALDTDLYFILLGTLAALDLVCLIVLVRL